MSNNDALDLRPETSGLALIDIQERLAAAMPPDVLNVALKNVHTLLEIARRLGLPVAVTEQYPKGLGRTLPVVAEELLKFPKGHVELFEKVEFDSTAVDPWMKFVEVTGRKQWIVVGMEAHVCVYQSVRGMVDRGLSVHVPRDAVTSRTKSNWKTGLLLCDRAGGLVTSTEIVLFDLLKQAGTDEFRALSKLVR
ncbi:MAG: isochorismatase family protein [Myxococcota bacterium]